MRKQASDYTLMRLHATKKLDVAISQLALIKDMLDQVANRLSNVATILKVAKEFEEMEQQDEDTEG